MKKLNHPALLASIVLVLLGLGFYPATASEPMSAQELEYFKKFEGKWGGSSWSIPGQSGRTKLATLEIVISEIDPEKRSEKLSYSSTGGVKSEDINVTYRASCEKDRIFLKPPTTGSSSNSRREASGEPEPEKTRVRPC